MVEDSLVLNGMFDEVTEKHSDEVALVFEDDRYTYAELRDRIRSVARGLLSIGVRPGDRVGVLTSNRPEWFVATYAATRIGATMVGLNTWYQREELEYALDRTNVSTLVTMESFLEQEYLEMLEAIAPGLPDCDADRLNVPELPTLQHVLSIGGERSWTIPWDSLADRGANVSEKRLKAVADDVRRTDPAYVLFSSGTTGRPKPIVLKHEGIVTNAPSIGARVGVSETDRFWLGLPLFFSFAACNESVTAFSHGATIVLQERFEAGTTLDLIEREECTIVYGMGVMFREMESTDRDLEATFESVRRTLAIAPEPLQRRLEDEHGVDAVVSGYGLTETSAICAIASHEASQEIRTGTVGMPLANADVRIMDFETDTEVPPGEEGEIRVRSRTLFKEYDRDLELTRGAFDDEGYLRTGDVGRLTANGRLVFIGREKDVIKTGGINVSPQEVETTLERHSDVEEAVVVPVPDEGKDEVVGAMIRPPEGTTVDLDDVRAFAKERLAAYKVPTVLERHPDSFPRTSTGKVRKTELQDQLSE